MFDHNIEEIRNQPIKSGNIKTISHKISKPIVEDNREDEEDYVY